jgi:hypothetical protein
LRRRPIYPGMQNQVGKGESAMMLAPPVRRPAGVDSDSRAGFGLEACGCAWTGGVPPLSPSPSDSMRPGVTSGEPLAFRWLNSQCRPSKRLGAAVLMLQSLVTRCLEGEHGGNRCPSRWERGRAEGLRFMPTVDFIRGAKSLCFAGKSCAVQQYFG